MERHDSISTRMRQLLVNGGNFFLTRRQLFVDDKRGLINRYYANIKLCRQLFSHIHDAEMISIIFFEKRAILNLRLPI